MKRSRTFVIVVILVAMLAVAVPASAWYSYGSAGHGKITELALYGKSIPSPWASGNIVDGSNQPDTWSYLDHCGIHYGPWMAGCGRDYAMPTWPYASNPKVSAVEFGWAVHFLEDAGQPYHGEWWYTDQHKAYEEYAYVYMDTNCQNIQSAVQTASTTAVPNTGNLSNDIQSHINTLYNAAQGQYSSLNTLVNKGMVTGPAVVRVCTRSYSIASGAKAVDENKLTSTEQSQLKSITYGLYQNVARYIKGLIDIEGSGKRQPNIE